MTDQEPKKTISPVATGGAGGHFERRVAACYLAALIAQTGVRGLAAGVVREVRFQQLYAGDPMDDLVVVVYLPAGTAQLALQIKRDLTFGEANAIFQEVMKACWDTFRSPDFADGTDRFGIALGVYSKTVDEHYRRVLEWARTSAGAADFFTRLRAKGLSNAAQREFAALIRKRLDATNGAEVTDEQAWRFLRSMVILHFDLEAEGSRDEAQAVETLRRALPPDQQDRAPDLFARLSEYAAEANATAGSFSGETLRDLVQADGFALTPPTDCAADLARLAEQAEFALADVRSDIAGTELPRPDLTGKARDLAASQPLLEIVGAAGTGKSALLKAMARDTQGQGMAVVLAGDRITGPGWTAFAGSLGLARSLPELLQAAGAAAQPTLFIDGIDRVVDRGAQQAVNDLLRAVAARRGSARPWSVVVTLREENRTEVQAWIDLRALGQPATLAVPGLSDEEDTAVGEAVPRLRPILALAHLRPVTRNPFLLSVCADVRITGDESGSAPATEAEVSQVWWERVVGHGGAGGRARQQALLALGRRDAARPGAAMSGEGQASETLFSLESDGILSREAGRDVYRFRHDLFEDWVLARVFDERREELPAYISGLEQPRGLARPLRHLATTLLERSPSADDWLRLLTGFEDEAALSPRWRQAVLTASLTSPRAAELLTRVEEHLVREDGRRLADLLVALRTTEVSPDVSLLPAAQSVASGPEEILPLLMDPPEPHVRTWARLLQWLVPRMDAVPTEVRPEIIRVIEIWQQKTAPGTIFRKDLGETALRWLKETERWREYVRA